MIVGAQDSSLKGRLEKNEREELSLKIETDKAKRYGKFADMSWRDHLVMLLQFGAAAEHCLMVEYLYAAYSLRTDDEEAERRAKIERWRGELLSVAREEMGHLLTVQNVLLLLGAPVSLGRENSLWAHEYYPYPFTLQPYNFDALACFVYAEMPRDYDDDPKLKEEIAERLKKKFGAMPEVHHVGELYDKIIDLISDPVRIPDSCFDGSTFQFQASWDEWGRGYAPAPRQLDPEGNRVEEVDAQGAPVGKAPSGAEAIVEIRQMASRRDAIKALVALSFQGEAPHVARKANVRKELRPQGRFNLTPEDADDAGAADEPSHFDRFVQLYRELEDETKKTPGWSPSAGVCSDPTTRPDFVTAGQTFYGISYAPLKAITAKHLAQIFNQRYRLLLNYLAHVFRITRSQPVNRPNLRAMLMHRIFCEMYNLKTLAGMLVRLKRLDEGDDGMGIRATPPSRCLTQSTFRARTPTSGVCTRTFSRCARRHAVTCSITQRPSCLSIASGHKRSKRKSLGPAPRRSCARSWISTIKPGSSIGAILNGLSEGAGSR